MKIAIRVTLFTSPSWTEATRELDDRKENSRRLGKAENLSGIGNLNTFSKPAMACQKLRPESSPFPKEALTPSDIHFYK